MIRRSASRPSARDTPRRVPPDPDAEFVGGAWDEAAPPSLDFDDELASRSLHEREPEDDFATLDGGGPTRLDADDAADLVDRVAPGGGPDADEPWDEYRDEPDAGVPERH